MKIILQYIFENFVNSIIFEYEGEKFFAHFLNPYPILKYPIADGVLTKVNKVTELFLQMVYSKSAKVKVDPMGRTIGFVFGGLLLPVEPMITETFEVSPDGICTLFRPSRLRRFDEELQFLHLILKFIQLNKTTEIIVNADKYAQTKSESIELGRYSQDVIYAENYNQMYKWQKYLQSTLLPLHVNDYTIDQYNKYEIRQNNAIDQDQTVAADFDQKKKTQFVHMNDCIYFCRRCKDVRGTIESVDQVQDGSVLQMEKFSYVFTKM
jgi:hypothetical protein